MNGEDKNPNVDQHLQRTIDALKWRLLNVNDVVCEGYSAEEAEWFTSLIEESMDNLTTLMQDVRDAKLSAHHFKLIKPKS